METGFNKTVLERDGMGYITHYDERLSLHSMFSTFTHSCSSLLGSLISTVHTDIGLSRRLSDDVK